MIDLVTQYYEPLKGAFYTQFFEPGQLFDAPALYLQDEPPATALTGRYDETSSAYHYSISRVSFDDFGEAAEPIHPLGIRSNERGLIIRAKFRPVVLLSTAPTVWKEGVRKSDQAFLVAPVYSLQGDPTGKRPYSSTFIERVKAYYYNSFFYLPANQKPAFREGFARFDRIQVVHRGWLRHRPIKLTEDALHCLRAWLFAYQSTDRTAVAEANEWLDLITDYRTSKLPPEQAS